MKILKSMILNYCICVLSSLKTIHASTNILVQLKASIVIGLMISPFAWLIEKLSVWSLINQDYIAIVLVAIAVDHILGTIKHLWFERDFSVKKNLLGLITKIGLVVACGILFEGLNVIIHKDSFIKEYLTILTRLIVFIYPASSAFASSSVISNGKFPPDAWMKKIARFKENLNTNEFKQKNEDNEQL